MMTIVEFINQFGPVSDTKQSALKQLTREKRIKKGDYFIEAGQHPKSLGFVRQGLFRYYYTNNSGTEFTKGFFDQHSILIAYSAHLEKRVSYFTIEALEDAIVEVVDYDQFLNLLEGEQCLNQMLLALLTKGYCMKEERERQFLLCNASERYNYFLKTYPGLDQRVKQHIIASYLGIAPESLSRIRRQD